MKMKVTSFFAFTLLAISIMTFGMTGPVFAANSFITAESSSGSVGNGDPIIISGTIVDYESAGHALTFTIVSPDNSIVQIGQVMGGVSSDGTFELNLVGGGPLWKNAGEYARSLAMDSTYASVMLREERAVGLSGKSSRKPTFGR